MLFLLKEDTLKEIQTMNICFRHEISCVYSPGKFKLIPRYQLTVNKSFQNLDSKVSVQWLQSYSKII